MLLEHIVGKEFGASCCSISYHVKGQPVYEQLSGRASFALDAPEITEDTLFNVGSVTKPVTSALIVKLAELGLVSLHDSVQRYIPEFKFAEVTLLQLLTHTSGLDGDIQVEWPKKGKRDAYLNTLYGIDYLRYAPDEANSYFTFGYSVLMDVLERVTGQSLEQFAQEQLFGPLGMRRSTFEPERVWASAGEEREDGTGRKPATDVMQTDAAGSVPGGAAIKVLPLHQESLEPETQLDGLDVTGDSGLHSTAADLMRFGRMLLDGGRYEDRQIFSGAATALMLREVTGGRFGRTPLFWKRTSRDLHGATNVDVHRCFSDFASPEAMGHNGFSGCMFFLDPAWDAVGVILTNSRRLHSDGRNYAKLSNVLMSLA
ncbi:hypothetical protein SY83_04385 [Paenibacillus swuensis]|uniref:Beta-lactamase-related domain-containing protein n=1 Tax=Paenibacillus swuensis TaxID=1178515 RepID=A0A172TFV0_9BACL|nr:serine hydrolase domain-containing protein [Paenibacillus swuensis]ANE45663.1 hypothetical protein SY83_04385 [Paenibacillus swuensis]